MNAYEELRLVRIAQNDLVLQRIGIRHLLISPQPVKKLAGNKRSVRKDVAAGRPRTTRSFTLSRDTR